MSKELKAAALGGGLVIAALIGVNLPPVATVQVLNGPAGTSYLMAYPDDGKAGYVAPHKQSDGGIVMLTVQPGCARRPIGGSALTCRRSPDNNPLDLTGSVVPELNRFPINEIRPTVGADCELIACNVWSGENADANESALLISILGGVIP